MPASDDLLAPPLTGAGEVDVPGWTARNGVPERQVVHCGAVPNRAMPRILREANVALFANRAEGGTNLVASGYSEPEVAGVLGNGHVVFDPNDGTDGVEPWVTDGTAAGTVLLKDISPGSASSSPQDFTRLLNGSLKFSASTAANGDELWMTDGTAAGTVMLEGHQPGPRRLAARRLQGAGGWPPRVPGLRQRERSGAVGNGRHERRHDADQGHQSRPRQLRPPGLYAARRRPAGVPSH